MCDWSRKKGFKSCYVSEAKNALENVGEITILPKKKTRHHCFIGKNGFLMPIS